MRQQDEYLHSKVMTASPHQLHLMVVDGAIRHANHALEALQQGEHETMHLALNRSREFVAELIAGLDERHASETVTQLRALFLFVMRNLAEADPRRDARRIESALKILRMHRETWVALAAQLSASEPRTEAAEPAGERCWSG